MILKKILFLNLENFSILFVRFQGYRIKSGIDIFQLELTLTVPLIWKWGT